MRKHTKIYFDYFGYTGQEFIACEVCGSKAVDIHHIDCRGMGSNKEKDTINNLMAVCRSCHVTYGDKKQHLEFLITKHEQFIYNYGKVY
jgi:5-methylcytosine-specific restriction endonuclease McrA